MRPRGPPGGGVYRAPNPALLCAQPESAPRLHAHREPPFLRGAAHACAHMDVFYNALQRRPCARPATLGLRRVPPRPAIGSSPDPKRGNVVGRRAKTGGGWGQGGRGRPRGGAVGSRVWAGGTTPAHPPAHPQLLQPPCRYSLLAATASLPEGHAVLLQGTTCDCSLPTLPCSPDLERRLGWPAPSGLAWNRETTAADRELPAETARG